jgi:hypothetical protein
MRGLRSPLLAAALLSACSGGSDAPTPPAQSCSSATAIRHGPFLAVADAQANASEGAATFGITGSFPRSVTGRSGAYERSVGALGFTVIDGFASDADGRPTAELVIFLTSRAQTGTTSLVPVTLAQFRDPNFFPAGPFAVYAEHFDDAAGSYTRYLLGKSGTVEVRGVSEGRIGRVELSLSMSGEWRDGMNASLGCGEITSATVNAPLLRLLTTTDSLRDTLHATVTGDRSEQLATSELASFQVLRPGQARLTIVGADPASASPSDSAKEVWLSLNGIPAGPDSVVLGEPTLDEARSGRATTSFGMLRVHSHEGDLTGNDARQVWRSTGGYVKLTNVVQTGPLAQCGWVSGYYAFDAVGADLSSGSGASLGTLAASGSFESRLTVLSPADTLIDAQAPAGASLARAASPTAASGKACPF